MGQELRTSLNARSWLGDSHGVVKMSARAAVTCRLGRRWRIHFQRAPLTWLACRGWILTGEINFLPGVSLCMAVWGSSQKGSWLPLERVIQENKLTLQCFLWPSLESHTCLFSMYYLLFVSANLVWEGTSWRCDYQEAIIIGGRLEAGFLKLLHSHVLWFLGSFILFLFLPQLIATSTL